MPPRIPKRAAQLLGPPEAIDWGAIVDHKPRILVTSLPQQTTIFPEAPQNHGNQFPEQSTGVVIQDDNGSWMQTKRKARVFPGIRRVTLDPPASMIPSATEDSISSTGIESNQSDRKKRRRLAKRKKMRQSSVMEAFGGLKRRATA